MSDELDGYRPVDGNGVAGIPAPAAPGLPSIREEWAIGDARRFAALPEDEAHLRDYWAILARHRWTVIAFLAAVVFSTAVVTFVATPLYRATVLIEIAPQNPNIVSFQDVVAIARSQREFFRTQYDVLRSRNLAARVIDSLDLASDPVFNPPAKRSFVGDIRGTIAGMLSRSAPSLEDPDPEVALRQSLVSRLLGGIDVAPRRDSYLVEVSFLSPSPRLASKVANAIAEQYVSLSVDQRLDAVQQGRAFIERQVKVTRASLERAENHLLDFSKKNAIVTVDEKENVEYKKLSELSNALTGVQRARMEKQALLAQTEQSHTGTISAVMESPVITALLSDIARDEAEYSRLSETFTSAYPRMQRLAAKIASERKRVDQEVGRLSATLRADYEAAVRNEELLQNALGQQREAVAGVNERAVDYKILKRQVDTERDIYKTLLQRLKEVEVSESIKASNIHVLDPAELPAHPDQPRPLRNLMLALMIGLSGGVGLAFFQEYLDSSIKGPEDVERHLRLATLGALPMLRAGLGKEQRTSISPEMITAECPSSVGAEAMRTLRTSLFLATAAGPPQRILVTSARPEEGKTCVAVNLAIVLAQMGKRVVLMDTDLRRPRLHRVFKREIAPGLTNYLTAHVDIPSVISTPLPERVPSLDLVTSGPVPPNPVELIDSREMMLFLEELSRSYDFVVADGPPSLGFADVPLLSRHMGGILLVVKCGTTPRKVVQQAASYLTRLRVKVLGAILNQVREKGHGDYYSYYSYYHYYHYSSRPEDHCAHDGGALLAGDGNGAGHREEDEPAPSKPV